MRFSVYFALITVALAAPATKVTTIAGNGVPGYGGDGSPATDAELNNPYGLTIGPDGALYICEVNNHLIRRYDPRTKELSTVAGNARQGYSGDGGLAVDASLNQPYDIAFDHLGNMYFSEMQNHLIRRIDAKTKRISTVAGTGVPGFGGDSGPAIKAQFRQPGSIAFDPLGRLLICDVANQRIRRVDLKSGIIETYAGNGDHKPTPDGAPLEGISLNGPRAIDFDRQGNVFLALRDGNAIYRIDQKVNRIYLVAGTGQKGYTGDGGPATKALLNGPKGISIYDNSIYIADTENHAIRKIDQKTGIITTVAGTGDRGDGPDGDPLHCKLARPHGVYVDGKGTVFIADSENHRIREVAPVPAVPAPGPVVTPKKPVTAMPGLPGSSPAQGSRMQRSRPNAPPQIMRQARPRTS